MFQIEKPYIAIYAGLQGSLSRVINMFMTPVTHELLEFAAAPGQLSRSEILHLRNTTHFYEREEYYLFGQPIQASPSPLIHNAAFQHHQLPHQYGLKETNNANEVLETLREPNCFGGSVTIPLKQTVLPLLDSLSNSAKEIGAVNTVVKRKGKLYGDNTDWHGIYQLIDGHLSAQKKKASSCKALILGAGGTAHAACYALSRLGISFEIFNRSFEKASALAEKFHSAACKHLSNLETIDIVISTIPPNGSFPLHDTLLSPTSLVVELVYNPRETPLIQQAKRLGCPIVEGVEILLEQACAQFEIWTQRPAPEKQ